MNLLPRNTKKSALRDVNLLLKKSEVEVLERYAWERGFFWGAVCAGFGAFFVRELIHVWLGV